MKKNILILISLFIFSSFAFAAEQKYVPGEVVVKFKSPVVSFTKTATKALAGEVSVNSYINSINEKHGLRMVEKAFTHLGDLSRGKFIKGSSFDLSCFDNIYRFYYPTEVDVEKIAAEFRNDPSVEYASPNPIRKIFYTPNDPAFKEYPNNPNQWGLYMISAEAGWNIETGSDEVIAVVDTGVRKTHQDLSGKVLTGYDFVNHDDDPDDDVGHGTHVAGIIGAKSDNGIGIAGIDWNCKILPVKVFYPDGHGSAIGNAITIAYGIVYAATMEADVINMSFGGSDLTTWESNALDLAHDTYDCVLVAAAGNDYYEIKSYPAAYSKVIAVAATSIYDTKTTYSSYGSWVDVSAPGGGDYGDQSEICSLYNLSDNSYAWMSGTSMATPFVSGLAGLLRAQNPSWSNDEIRTRIELSTDPISGYPGKLGTGRINIYSALAGGLFGRIYYPGNGSIVFGDVSIIGTATGEGFISYEISTKEGDASSPSPYVVLAGSTATKFNESLATWNTTGLSGACTIKLTVTGTAETKTSIVTINAGSPYGVSIIGSPLNGPNPFSPLKEQTIIHYKLSASADVTIMLFDIRGQLLWKRKFSSGENGGKQGDNLIPWNGNSDFHELVPNGVYVYKIIADNHLIGKGKIAVIK